MNAVDITGQKFGRLTAIKRIGPSKDGAIWLCKCDCGNETRTPAYYLRSGNTKSCGCSRKGILKGRAAKHGHSTDGRLSPTYLSWVSMKSRCDNARTPNFESYGARGISYDPAWADFRIFLRDMGERPEGTSLDRIDGARGYSKENCRWATARQQTANRRNTRRLTANGETLTISEWADRLGLTWGALYKRINAGRTLEEIANARRRSPIP